MLKKSASGVLASLWGSTYRSVRLRFFARCGLAGRPFWASCAAFPYCAKRADHWISTVPR